MDIDVISETRKLEDYWKDRNTQLQEDRNIINLTLPVKKLDEMKWISNEPKVFYDTSVALISSYAPRFRMPLSINPEADEKDRMNKAERLCIGVLRELDKRQYARGQTYWLREMAYWVLSGWYAVFNIVRTGNDGVEFIADHWDPMNVYPEWDADGLVKCARTFTVDRETAQAMLYKWQLQDTVTLKDKLTDVKVINYFQLIRRKGKKNKVINAIYIGDTPAKAPKVMKNLDHIPIHIGTIGVPERGSSGWQKRIGENIIAANRDMYRYTNLVISLMAEIMAATAYPNLVSQTRSGAPAVKGEDVRGHGQVIPTRLGESLELLKHAATPAEALELLQYTLKQLQKGSLPDVVYGGIPVELSGFAISQLMAAIKYKISPYLNTMQYIGGLVMSDFLNQYKMGKYPKITLQTINPKAMRKGNFYIEEFSRDDVPESSYVEMTIPITSALDKTQQMLFARQALQPPQLISRETLWDGILEIQDSEQEYARILQDETLELPIVKQIAMIEQLRFRVKAFEVKGLIAEAQALNRYIMMLEQQLGMRQQNPTMAGQSGVSPNQMPPEMGAGGSNPDSVRAALGVGPPGLNRRPQTTDERAASTGRKGRLVSPSGDTMR